jgi:hypothetical protein
MKFNLQKVKKYKSRGFILPLTLLLTVIVLTISAGISAVLSKELYFSKLSRESQIAYYAADDAMMCAIMVDDKYLDSSTGLGIFPYDGLADASGYIQSVLNKANADRLNRGFPQINSINDIKCAGVAIFDPATSSFSSVPFTRINTTGATENGQRSTFNMRMDLGDGSFRCSSVVVSKTINYRQVIARGFTSCRNGNRTTAIERAVVNTTENQ